MNLINTIGVCSVKTLIKALTVFTIYTYYTFAQVNVPMIVSPFIGEKLDRIERNYFGLFPHFDGFEKATFYLNPDSSLSVSISYETGLGIKDTLIERYRMIASLKHHINQIINNPIAPSNKIKEGSLVEISLFDSTSVQGELIETATYHLQIFNSAYKIPGKLDLASFGYRRIAISDISEIKCSETNNIAPLIFGGIGVIGGGLWGIIKYEESGGGGGFKGISATSIIFGLTIGAAVGILIGNVLPINVESETTFISPFSKKDIEGLKDRTRVKQE